MKPVNITAPIYLFRHGLATLSPQGYGPDNLTVSVLPEGLVAVSALAEFMATVPVHNIFTSPYHRCQQTAGVVGKKLQLSPTVWPLAGEYLPPDWPGFAARMEDLVELLMVARRPLALCTHGAVIAALSHLLTNRPVTEWDQWDFPPPAGLRIIQNNTIQQLAF
jgi:broad specificity phosphatase PhoE